MICDSVPKTDALPRDGLTVWEHAGQRYCLQSEPDAQCIRTSSGAQLQQSLEVQLYSVCLQALKGGRVPDISLVRLDPGSLPALPQLTWLEVAIIATPYRTLKMLVVCKPTGVDTNRPSSTCQKALRGHVVPMPNPGPDALLQVAFLTVSFARCA